MQIVGYEPSGVGAALLVSDGTAVRRRSLEPGRDLSMPLGTRQCAGAVDGETHHPCDRPMAPYCDRHRSTWVCARCTGTCLKAEMDCYEDHAVYLAAFAPDTVKVGVTRLARLETRLREQGADRAAHLHTVSNGRIAREIEAEIASEHPDRVSVDSKIDGLARPLDDMVWRGALAAFDVVDEYDLTYGFDLASRPVRETIASGTVRGVKGRVLVLERAGTTYAVDMRDLVGYEVRDERGSAPTRRVQSSLGSFD